MYELCSKFKKLPSEVEAEDAKTIEEFLVIMNAIGEHENKETRKTKRAELKGKLKEGTGQ